MSRTTVSSLSLLTFAQAAITQASFDAITAMISTPLSRNFAACSMKGGIWFAWHVGVKAPLY